MIESNITNIPWISEGEIIGVEDPVKGDQDRVTYKVEVLLRNGSKVYLRYVEEASLFGGIGDYYRRRTRARDFSEEPAEEEVEANKREAAVGERCYVAFVNGSFYKPIIIAYKQHPNQVTEEFLSSDNNDIASVWQYQGLREETDSLGRYRIIRKGAPVVKYEPGIGGGLGAAAAGLGSLLGGDTFAGDDSPALEPQDTDERVVMEWLEKGLFRIRDPGGNVIEFNHSDRTGIYISDNDWRSDEDPDTAAAPESGGQQFSANKTQAEYLWLAPDKGLAIINARKIVQLYSFDRRKDVTEGDHSHKIFGNSEYTIGGDKIVTVKGDREDSIEGDYDIFVTGDLSFDVSGDHYINITGDMETFVEGDASITVSGDFVLFTEGDQELKTDGAYSLEASGSAKLVLDSGQVALGANGIEVVDQLIQALDAFIQNAPTMVSTAVGPGVLNPSALTALTKIQASLNTIKGSL